MAEYLLQYENMDAKTFEQVFTDPAALQPRRPIRLWRPRRSRTPARRRSMAQIECVLGDITRIEVDAIGQRRQPYPAGGRRCGRSHPPAAGPELLAECRTLHGCETGQAKITKGYKLPAKYVIHTPGPIWKGGGHGEAELLASCYRSSLTLAVEHGCRTVAFPGHLRRGVRLPAGGGGRHRGEYSA